MQACTSSLPQLQRGSVLHQPDELFDPLQPIGHVSLGASGAQRGQFLLVSLSDNTSLKGVKFNNRDHSLKIQPVQNEGLSPLNLLIERVCLPSTRRPKVSLVVLIVFIVL